VIGISALFSAGPGGGYGFAIPVNQVRRVVQMLVQEGRARYPYIGVSLRSVQDLEPEERGKLGTGIPRRGALVSRILKGAPAARAGMRPGDVITTIDNQSTLAAEDVAGYVALQTIGAKVMVGIVRNGKERTLAVRLDELPADVSTSAEPEGPLSALHR
jgi:serine protease Do